MNYSKQNSPTIIGIRHHSPICAKLVCETITRIKPAIVLIEGPMDFNSRLDELFLSHELPIAIYSYGLPKNANSDRHHSSWTPFAEHSPEWQALIQAKSYGAHIRFMDLPAWHHAFHHISNRYADLSDHEQYDLISAFESKLCEELGLTNSDALWESLFESESDLDVLSEKLSLYFEQLRGETLGSLGNQAREKMMASWINWAVSCQDGPVLVVCGGYHAPMLAKLITQHDKKLTEPTLPPITECTQEQFTEDQFTTGSYLVPYTYKRLDAFTGYASGMPSPLWQQWVWKWGLEHAGMELLESIFKQLRRLGQAASTADMAATLLKAQGLAQLRGHTLPLRIDWLDALAGALIKDALEVPLPWSYRGTLLPHTDPMLVLIMDVISGNTIQGKLASQTPKAPLLAFVQDQIKRFKWQFPTTITLELLTEQDRHKSHFLHQLVILNIPGIILETNHKSEIAFQAFEKWHLQSPFEQKAALIEASIYGATAHAAASKKLESELYQLSHENNDCLIKLVELLNQAVFAGLNEFNHEILKQLEQMIARETQFEALGMVLDIAYPLYRHSASAGMRGRPILRTIIETAFDRSLWLCESYGFISSANTHKHILAFKAIWSITRDALAMPSEELNTLYPNLHPKRTIAVWQRKFMNQMAHPLSRGAALGGLISLSEHNEMNLDLLNHSVSLLESISIENIGDLLTGLLALARASLLHQDDFLHALNHLVLSFSEDEFLHALTSMRAAFSWLPARERGEISARILKINHIHNLPSEALTRPIEPDLALNFPLMQRLDKQIVNELVYWGLINE
ncbi:DUF5682 family protein [Thorsellia anophelis]|uniref:4-aminobutyrate aminotransferase n=1 Tax=Thorsellia anophelis DSM 18579 TaxID=1123402 RepID=A0A1I0CN51_9GAMM|nr:DUF5682 family protein [Thorsellia anophelis]SET20911.1 hypothetical protein SAMN02583745_01692 [Thorsellia anophelis DSM 18579]